MTKYLTTYEELEACIGRKIKCKYYNNVVEGVLFFDKYKDVCCNIFFITDFSKIIRSNISDIELIEEDIAIKTNSEKEQKPSVVINGKEYQVEKTIEEDNQHIVDESTAGCCFVVNEGEMIQPADNINHPSHYQGKIECIDYLQDKLTAEEFKGFLKGNILKYLNRATKKENEIEDYKKSQWYMNKLITTMEKK